MEFISTDIPGVVLVEPRVFRDERGFFLETHHAGKFSAGGIDVAFVQDNHSKSVRGTLRGLHGQRRRPQGKLVRVIAGEIFDVALDIRPDSPTFGKWFGATLSAENFRQMYVPPGLLHGFCVTSDTAEVLYKCTDLYDPTDEIGAAWDDPALAIAWPVADPILSEKDKRLPSLAELIERMKAEG
jgi:dTDP-4-dehydrorhamnose 3,5-epimerase